MDKSYNFMSDTEPTIEQLDNLMLEVLKDVKERAAKAEAKFKALQASALQQALEDWQQKQKNNDHE